LSHYDIQTPKSTGWVQNSKGAKNADSRKEKESAWKYPALRSEEPVGGFSGPLPFNREVIPEGLEGFNKK
jgi:hypothetical protein